MRGRVRRGKGWSEGPLVDQARRALDLGKQTVLFNVLGVEIVA
jgi:hypothetical protein